MKVKSKAKQCRDIEIVYGDIDILRRIYRDRDIASIYCDIYCDRDMISIYCDIYWDRDIASKCIDISTNH